MINKNKMIFGGVGLLVGVVLVFYLASFVIPRALVTLTKASGTAKVSIKNSLIIGERIMAKADGLEKCVVDVFVVDADGKGVAGKQVQLIGLGNLSKTSDDMGKANFELTSDVANQYDLTANISGAMLGKTVTVTFR